MVLRTCIGAVCVAIPLVLSAFSAQAARLDALSEARWDYAGMYLAYPVDNQLGTVFPEVTGPSDVTQSAGNFASLEMEGSRTDTLQIFNPSSDRIVAVPAFDYAFLFAFGDFANPTDPGDYAVSMRGVIDITPGTGPARQLAAFAFDDVLSCPDPYCFFTPLRKSSGSFPELVFLELDPGERMTLTLRTRASVDVRPLGAVTPTTPVPVPMPASLALTGLGLLVALRRRSAAR